jgi:hypothetical protein
MVAQEIHYRGGGYGPSIPHFDGWYYGLFGDPSDAHEPASFVADYFASVRMQTADYAGVSGVRMGLFVVDTGGEARVAVGPVTRAFQTKGPIAPRYADDDATRVRADDPWAASYTVSAAVTKPFVVRTVPSEERLVLEVTSSRYLGPLEISLLDHHRLPLATVTHDVRASAKVRYEFEKIQPKPGAFGVEGIRVRAGDYTYFDLTAADYLLSVPTTRWELGPSATRFSEFDRPRPGRGKRY